MIDEKKIEEASYKYADKYYPKDMYYMLTEGCNSISYNSFSEGARWAIQEFLKGLWHPAEEGPKMLMPAVVEYKDGTNLGYDYHELLTTFKNKEETWQEYMDDWYGKGNTTRWFYIYDVVPKQKGGEQ